ncbi:parvulin-type peptidyl-prolyl cis-trans isomerase [Dunaliella salina]|uniref:Peptidyl-prolyl cis-trans isomerase n=1 Tax=Dunaliella salina TaxID=3046 RepID=A0ABQ7GZ62_DUNSA|nr:parvulin-type peptidyl-prolyl cis-trans isomerase [Dunaliella salina]|eukprot:KAF5839900.1 parvulin-type peptidyl-prolyl cis-trans isomerase [Dunaliella salina]
MQVFSRAALGSSLGFLSKSSRLPAVIVRAGSSGAATRPTLKRVRHIMVSKDKEDVISHAEKELAASGKDKSHVFASLARQASECATARVGGDLGWLQRGTYFPSFEDVVQQTEVGSIARATTPRGLHLLLVEGERPESVVEQMYPQELAEIMQNPAALEEGIQFIDVREEWEHEEANLGPRFKLMPLSQASKWIPTVTQELDPSKHTVCLCHHGIRSMQMSNFLVQQGFQQVSNVVGGIDAYSKNVDPSVPEY